MSERSEYILARLRPEYGPPSGWPYSEEELAAIIEAVPAALDAERASRMVGRALHLAHMFAGQKRVEATKAKRAESREQLERVQAAAHKLEEALRGKPEEDLRGLDPEAWRALLEDREPPEDLPPGTSPESWEPLEPLALLQERLTQALEAETIRKRSGKPAPPLQLYLISRLVSLWEASTGLRAGYTGSDDLNGYGGPFLDFAEAVALPLLGPHFIRRRDFAEWIKKRNRTNREP
ncbi:MAG TPA: hypothetical protein VFE20_05100 [Thermoleophilia bacterium]|nr:hypothetical protein [Thermoleophilia bacterium]